MSNVVTKQIVLIYCRLCPFIGRYKVCPLYCERKYVPEPNFAEPNFAEPNFAEPNFVEPMPVYYTRSYYKPEKSTSSEHNSVESTFAESIPYIKLKPRRSDPAK
jgi:hypothetical protein